MRTGIFAHFIYCYILMPPTVPDTQKAFIQILSNGWVTEFPLSQGQSSTTLGHFKPLSIGTFPLGLKRTKVFTVLKSFLSGFPGGAVAESLPANAGHTGSNPGLGGSRILHPACRGAAGPLSHNCWACASGACAPQQERPREARASRWRVAPACHNWRKPSHRNEDPTQPKIK